MLGTIIRRVAGQISFSITLLLWIRHKMRAIKAQQDQLLARPQLPEHTAERFRQEMEGLALKYYGKPFGELNGTQQQAIFLEVYGWSLLS